MTFLLQFWVIQKHSSLHKPVYLNIATLQQNFVMFDGTFEHTIWYGWIFHIKDF